MQCPRCIAEVPEGSRFCHSCGAELPLRCGECANINPVGSSFCVNCGARLVVAHLTPLAALGPAPPSRLDAAERRQVTVMFCDLVGPPAFSVGLDPEDLQPLIAAYHQKVTEEAQRLGGFVARQLGDSILVYFGYPAAHEDDAERAVHAGLALIREIRALRLGPEIVLDARVGIATGLVVAGMIGAGPAQQWTVLGDTPNLAARLQALAEPGTVLIGPTTHHLIGELFECRALGAREIKGFTNPLEIWQVLRPCDVANRFWARRALHTPIVGRADEMALLLRCWEQAKGGEGRIVLIGGEPGIGKSRLTWAFEERIAREPHTRQRWFGSVLHQDSAFFPIIGQLEHAAGIRRDDGAETRLDKLATLVEPHSADPEQDVALLAELLGIDGGERYPAVELSPRIRMERTLAVLLSQLVRQSAHQPLLMIFEDAQWIDPSSHEALQQAIERLRTLPILLIVTARPEFQPRWRGLPHVAELALNRLSRDERTVLIEQLTPGKKLAEPVVQQIVERTDGVPLFVEELTQTAVESGRLSQDVDGGVLSGPLPEITLPVTLQGSLLARLDRLGAAREIAQQGAAIGREFSYDLLAAVNGHSDAELAEGLGLLVASGLVQQVGRPPTASYSFKHALMQDAAYSTLLRAKRAVLHARIAEAYDQRLRDIADTRPELMAHHLTHAGLAERAIGFWLKAARIAIARGAAAEAAAQLHRGLALLGEIPHPESRRRLELELQIALGNALAAATGYTGTETDAAFRRARELCLEGGDTVQLLRVTWGQFTGHFAGGRQRPALAVANELLALSERLDDEGGRQMGHAGAGSSLLHLASFIAARTQFERALAIDTAAERERTHLYGQSGRVTALAYMSLDLLMLGFLDTAQRLAERSVEEARRLAHPTTLCFAHSIVSRVYYLLGDWDALALHAAMVAELADAHGLGLWRALGRVYAGWSRAGGPGAGGLADGVAMVRDGIARYRAIGSALSMPFYLASLARLEGAAGNHWEALELLSEAQIVSRDEPWISAEIHRLTGEAMLAANGDAAAAEREFRAALALAREQGAKLWALRAETSLERLSEA